MSSLDPASKSLVDAARSARPSSVARQRMTEALAAKLGASALGGAALAPRPAGLPLSPSSAALAAGGPMAKVVGVALVVLSAAGAGTYAVRSRAPERSEARVPTIHETPTALQIQPRSEPPMPSAASEPESAATSSPIALGGAKDVPHDERTHAADDHLRACMPASPSAGVAALKPEPVSISEEVADLRRAKLALDEGEGERALATLDELASRRPEGALREERLAAHVLALCAAGRTDDAAREARAFLGEMPNSIHAARIRSSCAFAASEDRE